MKAHPLLLLCLVVLLMCTLVVPASAQAPVPEAATPPQPPGHVHAAPTQDPKGLWFMPAGSAQAVAAAPANSGGPDNFGYTWDDTWPFNYMDLSGGYDTGINSNVESAGPIDLGFDFRFYENVRNRVYVSRNGFLTFSNNYLWNTQSQIPSAEMPNEVIAPHWAPMYGGIDYVRYTRGGSAPARWFAVEWRTARSTCCNDGNEEYTFEAILSENGDMLFQYGNMVVRGGWYCQASGIEDSTGLDGLATSEYCRQIAPNHAVHIARPGPTARVSLSPKMTGSFGSPGGSVSFNATLRNTGELGADTYDFYASSEWPTTLYHEDAITPLSDTDGDGLMDTGSLPQGVSKTVIVKTLIPGGALAGNSQTTTLTAISSRNMTKQQSARFQVGVPAAFAASYSQSGRTKLGYYRPSQQTAVDTSEPSTSGYDAAATTTPDGRIVQAWRQYRDVGGNRYVSELYYSLRDDHGNALRPAARITYLGSPSTDAYDNSPSVAVTPDGHIGVAWYRYYWNSNTSESNYNIYLLVLDGNGDMVVQPVNLTNNGAWGRWDNGNVPQFFYPSIAATPDNRFVIAWERYTYDGNSSTDRTWYAVRRADGSEVRGASEFPSGSRSWGARLTTLQDGSVLLVQRTGDKLGYGRLDSSGNVLGGLMIADASYPAYLDAAQLPNGNILVAWANGSAYYLLLNSGLQVIRGATSLGHVSVTGDYYLSVTPSGNRAVLTWGDSCCDYMPNLYYALLDDAGNVVTPPMIFFSDFAGYYVRLPYNGQGNTPLIGDTNPPSNPANLSSTSHTVGAWSRDNTVDVVWQAAVDDDSGVAGYSTQWDASPTSVPDAAKDIDAVVSATSPALPDGKLYFHIRAVDKEGNWAEGAAHLGPFNIDTTPPDSAASSPAFVVGPIPVTWWGTDKGAGIASYDVWVNQSMEAGWTKWLANTKATSAIYEGAHAGDTVYFRTVARDAVGNVESTDRFSQTRVAAKALTGHVLNLRDQPISSASVVSPGALNTARTDAWGRYALYFANAAGVQPLTASRTGYGSLPPMQGVELAASTEPIDFVLPPQLDAIRDGGFESGGFTIWASSAATPWFTPTVSSAAAHTGAYGLRLIAGPTDSTGPLIGVTQGFEIPDSATAPVLSFVYKALEGGPDEKLAVLIGKGIPSLEQEKDFPLTPGGWTHVSLDISAFRGSGYQVTFGLAGTLDRDVYVDEVSIGDAPRDNYPLYLPTLRK